MITIAVVNGKGGVGKSTLATALAVHAASEGKRIAVVDMDPQRSVVEWWARRGKTDNPAVYEGAETVKFVVPLLRDLIEITASLSKPPSFELPNAFSAGATTAKQTNFLQGTQMFCDTLTRNVGTLGQLNN